MKRLLVVVLLICLSGWSLAQKPNILWLSTEDISPYLSMYGDSTAKTPNLDRLAAESLIFTEAYSTVAVCGPSRSSIITGMYPVSIGTHNMRTGKDIQGWGTRDYSGESNAMDIDGNAVPHYSAVIPAEVKCFTEFLRKDGYYCTNNPKTDYQFAAPVTAWDENGPNAHWKNRPDGQPFFSVFNHGVTHESQVWRRADEELTVDPATVTLPDYFPDTDIIRTDVARMYSNIEVMDQQIGEKLKELDEAGLMDNTIIFFFSDHGGPLPRGKRAHYESGLRVPLMVRLPDQLKQQFVDEMISFVDFAPTVLSIAGVEIPEYLQGKAFLGKQKSKEGNDYIVGTGDRFDENSDRMRTVITKDYIYVKNYYPELPSYKNNGYRLNMPMMQEMIELRDADRLNDDQGYWFREQKTEEEFYIRSTDPFNLKNRVNYPEFEEEISRMRNRLTEWQDENGDLGDIPEKELFLQMWPHGQQPTTVKPKIKIAQGKFELSCKTQGSSIAYLVSDEAIVPTLDSGWKVYKSALEMKSGQFLYVMSTRIGFKDSEVVEWH